MATVLSAHLPADRRWPPESTIVIDRRGLPVDVSGTTWRLNNPLARKTINWALFPAAHGHLLDGARAYIAHLIKTQSEHSVDNAFYQIRILARTPAFQDAAAKGADIPILAFSQARSYLRDEEQYKLHHARAMHRWCARLHYRGFSHDVLKRIERWRIPGNPKGHAVRSQDPDDGPFTAIEVADIVRALRAARLERSLRLDLQAAVGLALSLGSNAGQFASLRDEDVEPIKLGEPSAGCIISVPRHKKGDVHSRDSFRKRKLSGIYGEIVLELVSSNRALPGYEQERVHPLFRHWKKQKRTDLDPEWVAHIRSDTFTDRLKSGLEKLGVVRPDGQPVHVTCRRFRYTAASRMRNNGASKAAVADVLDHTDLQNVDVYWEIFSDIVDHLDPALSTAMAPIAQAFAGIILKESDAVRGDDPASRRYLVDRETDTIATIGNCGSFGFCGITAPLACYTCVKFQAWIDGPHQKVLDFLLRRRAERKERGLSPKMIAIEDEIIIRVKQVIAHIAAMRAEQAT